jgi:hypothetical protein
MTVLSRFFDHDAEWVIANNESVFKLGSTETTIGNTETATLGATSFGFMRMVWFIVPFDMQITHVSGGFQDDDMTSYLGGVPNHAGIWIIEGFSTAGNVPGAQTGSKTFKLKYITTSVYAANGYLSGWVWHDQHLKIALNAGDAVFAGTYIGRSGTSDDATINMTVSGEER